jgi:hypothetical protein
LLKTETTTNLFDNTDNISLISEITSSTFGCKNNNISFEKLKKYINGLSYTRADEYDYWTKVCWGIYNISKDNNWGMTKRNELIHLFSKKSDKYNEHEVDKFIEKNIKDCDNVDTNFSEFKFNFNHLS